MRNGKNKEEKQKKEKKRKTTKGNTQFEVIHFRLRMIQHTLSELSNNYSVNLEINQILKNVGNKQSSVSTQSEVNFFHDRTY